MRQSTRRDCAHNILVGNEIKGQKRKTMVKSLRILLVVVYVALSQAGMRARLRGFVNNRLGTPITQMSENTRERTTSELKSGIANFYDESSGIWLDVWGEHMHHGYYPHRSYKNHTAAQIDMVDRSLTWAYGGDIQDEMSKCRKMLDVGCGVGGSSRHIVKKFGCSGIGISLSPFQIFKAIDFTKTANLEDKLDYQVADAMNTPFPDDSFDLTWSMESGEHMPDKEQFIKEMVRVTAPNGRIIVVTWCHRELGNGEVCLSEREQRLLRKINKAYYLPPWVPASKYVELMKSTGLQDVRSDDWSDFVMPFWPAVFRSALVPRNFVRMIRSGKTTVKGAWAGLWMLQGFSTGAIKFALITGKKPAADEVGKKSP